MTVLTAIIKHKMDRPSELQRRLDGPPKRIVQVPGPETRCPAKTGRSLDKLCSRSR